MDFKQINGRSQAGRMLYKGAKELKEAAVECLEDIKVYCPNHFAEV
jgi:hypothetical protein